MYGNPRGRLLLVGTATPSNPDDTWLVHFGPGSGGAGNDGTRNPQRVPAVREP